MRDDEGGRTTATDRGAGSHGSVLTRDDAVLAVVDAGSKPKGNAGKKAGGSKPKKAGMFKALKKQEKRCVDRSWRLNCIALGLLDADCTVAPPTGLAW